MKKLLHHRNMLLIVIALLLLAAGLRVVAVRQFNAGPGARLHLWTESDMHYFNAWAGEIAAGDLLSAKVGAPLHAWQVRFAELYAVRYLGRDEGRPLSRDEAGEMWTAWMGRGSFYQDPLYPYLIAAVYALTGKNPLHIFVLQQMVGLVTILLFFLSVKRGFGRRVGLVTLALSVLYPLALYYELILLRETLLLFFSCLLLFLTQRLQVDRQRTTYLLFGLVAGLAVLLKSSIALLVVLLAGGLLIEVWLRQAKLRPLLFAGTWMLCGAVLAFLPLWYRNWALGVPLLQVTKEGAFAFALHNVSAYPPLGGDVFSEELLGMLVNVLYRSDFDFVATVIESIKSHGSVTAYLAFVWSKFLFVWSWFEIPNNENFYYARQFAPVLAFLPLSFGFLAPLALPGLAFGVRRWHRIWPFYVFVGYNLLLLVIFFNVARLRISLAVGLLPFAAYLLVCLERFWQKGRYVWVAGLVLMAAALVVWVNRPLPPGSKVIRPDDYYLSLSLYYWPQMEGLAASGQEGEAVQLCKESVRYEPRDELEGWIEGRQPASELDLDLAMIFREANQRCSVLAEQAGLPQDAARFNERASLLQAALLHYDLRNR